MYNFTTINMGLKHTFIMVFLYGQFFQKIEGLLDFVDMLEHTNFYP